MENYKLMSNTNQLKYGAILSYLAIILNILAALIYTPWMIHQVGQSQYGIYTLANSVISLFLVDFGLSAATSRYLSKYRAEGREEEAERFLGAVYKLYLLIDALIFLLLIIIFFLIDVIYAKLSPTELAQFRVVYIIAASFSVINFPFVTLNGILTAYEKFIPLKLADIIYRLLVIVLTALALIFGGGLYALVAVNALVGIVVIIFKYCVIKKSVQIKPAFSKTSKGIYKEIFSFSIWSTIATLGQRLIFNITPTILSVTASASAIAVFGVIITIESNTYVLSGAISGMFMPKISRIYAGKDSDKDIMPLMINIGRFQFALMSLIFVGFLLLGKSFMTLWMGVGYESAYYGALIVIFPSLIYNSLQIANTTLVVKKKVKVQAYITVLIGVINVIFSFAFSSIWGVLGACLSIFIAYTVRNIGYLIVHHKITGANIPLFVQKCYVNLMIPLIGTVLFGVVLNTMLCDAGWVRLVIKGVLVVIAYVTLLWTFSLSRQEKGQVVQLVKNARKN